MGGVDHVGAGGGGRLPEDESEELAGSQNGAYKRHVSCHVQALLPAHPSTSLSIIQGSHPPAPPKDTPTTSRQD
jgi:hypothetical protein